MSDINEKINCQAELFLPEIIKHLAHSSPTFTKDGLTMYWSTLSEGGGPRKIQYAKKEKNKWSEPMVATFSGIYHDDQPFISRDGQRMIFASLRPSQKDDDNKLRLWQMNRYDNAWTEPIEMNSPIGFWTPSLTNGGSLYCIDNMSHSNRPESENRCGIYRSVYKNGFYQKGELLPEHINLEGALNWCPYIAPDESYLLFSSDRPGSSGSGDLYITFKASDDTWSEVINLGPDINTCNQERFPGISPDGRFLYFTRSCSEPEGHDLYRVKTDFIDSLKKSLNL